MARIASFSLRRCRSAATASAASSIVLGLLILGCEGSRPSTADAGGEWPDDAVVLALRLDQESLRPAPALIDNISNALRAVEALDHPARDSVLAIFGIRPELGWDPYVLLITVSPTAPWLRFWLRGNPRTLVPAIDSVLGLLRASVRRSPDYDELVFELRAREPVQWFAAHEKLRLVPHIEHVGPAFMFTYSGRHVVVERHGSNWRFTYHLGWMDCMAGCVHGHHWVFEADTAGSASFVISGGDPIPDPPLPN